MEGWSERLFCGDLPMFVACKCWSAVVTLDADMVVIPFYCSIFVGEKD